MKIRKKLRKNWKKTQEKLEKIKLNYICPQVFFSAHSVYFFHSKIPQNLNKFIQIQKKLKTTSLLLKKYNKLIRN